MDTEASERDADALVDNVTIRAREALLGVDERTLHQVTQATFSGQPQRTVEHEGCDLPHRCGDVGQRRERLLCITKCLAGAVAVRGRIFTDQVRQLLGRCTLMPLPSLMTRRRTVCGVSQLMPLKVRHRPIR